MPEKIGKCINVKQNNQIFTYNVINTMYALDKALFIDMK